MFQISLLPECHAARESGSPCREILILRPQALAIVLDLLEGVGWTIPARRTWRSCLQRTELLFRLRRPKILVAVQGSTDARRERLRLGAHVCCGQCPRLLHQSNGRKRQAHHSSQSSQPRVSAEVAPFRV